MTQEHTEPSSHVSADRLQWYVYGRLTPGETKDLESHLAECKECVRSLTDTIEFFRNFSKLTPQDASSGERRREPRFSTESCARIQVLSPFSPIVSTVRIVDVSKDGMKLETNERLAVGLVIRVRLNNTFILGEVRYCNQSGEGFYVGVQIQDVYSSPAASYP